MTDKKKLNKYIYIKHCATAIGDAFIFRLFTHVEVTSALTMDDAFFPQAQMHGFFFFFFLHSFVFLYSPPLWNDPVRSAILPLCEFTPCKSSKGTCPHRLCLSRGLPCQNTFPFWPLLITEQFKQPGVMNQAFLLPSVARRGLTFYVGSIKNGITTYMYAASFFIETDWWVRAHVWHLGNPIGASAGGWTPSGYIAVIADPLLQLGTVALSLIIICLETKTTQKSDKT